jgi:hypothetical protein
MDAKQKRLEHLVKSYKADFDKLWDAYTALCKQHNESPDPLLTDVSHYEDEEGILTVSTSPTEATIRADASQFLSA